MLDDIACLRVLSEEIDYPIWNDALFYQIQTDASGNTY
jgi:hypothetical protein